MRAGNNGLLSRGADILFKKGQDNKAGRTEKRNGIVDTAGLERKREAEQRGKHVETKRGKGV